MRLSPAQNFILHNLETIMFIHDSDLNGLQKKSFEALESKGLVQKQTDCNGADYWELSGESYD